MKRKTTKSAKSSKKKCATKKAPAKTARSKSSGDNPGQILCAAVSAGQMLEPALNKALTLIADATASPLTQVFEISADETVLHPLCGPFHDDITLEDPVEALDGRSPTRLLGREWKNGLCLPLMFQDIPQGMLCVGGGNNKLSPEAKKELGGFATQLAMTMYTCGSSESRQMQIDISNSVKTELLSEAVPDIIGFTPSLHLLRCPEGGGDFHEFVTMRNGRLGIVVGKTSGWGMKASMNLARLIPLAREGLSKGMRLPEVMENLNADLITHGKRSHLVSVVMMILDTRTRKASICRAGSVKMLRFKGGELSVFDEALGPHLGAFSGVNLTEIEMQFAPGDSLVLMTDGINKFTDKESFSLNKTTQKLATRMQSSGGTNLAQQVVDMLRERRGAAQLHTDLTVLGIQREAKSDPSRPVGKAR